LNIPDPNPRALATFHFVMMCVWTALVIPTVVWWRNSIAWIAFMSIYAIWVGHFFGFDAARAAQRAEET
jgi:hypothetical protein